MTKHMTECTKEFTYDGHKVMQRTFQRDGDRHFVFGSCDHHCPGFYEDVLTHYGTSCPADEKSADTVLPENSAEANKSNCSPGTFTNTNGECEECPIGTYADEKGLTTCKRCQPGQFNPFPEAQGCMACPDGYFQPNWGQQYCVACDSDAALGEEGVCSARRLEEKVVGRRLVEFYDDDDSGERRSRKRRGDEPRSVSQIRRKVNGPVRHRADATKRRRIQESTRGRKQSKL